MEKTSVYLTELLNYDSSTFTQIIALAENVAQVKSIIFEIFR